MNKRGTTSRAYTSKKELEEKNALLMARLAALEGKQNQSDDEGEIVKEEATTRIALDDLITVMSLLTYPLNLSTKEKGQGTIYKFESFGQIKKVLYKNLLDILENHRNFMEWGYFIILDSRVIKEHGLQEVYSRILTKDKIVSILSGSSNCLDLYKSCNEIQQREILAMIVERLRDNPEAIDLNVVDKLSRLSGLDIMERAESAREYIRIREEVAAEK